MALFFNALFRLIFGRSIKPAWTQSKSNFRLGFYRNAEKVFIIYIDGMRVLWYNFLYFIDDSKGGRYPILHVIKGGEIIALHDMRR